MQWLSKKFLIKTLKMYFDIQDESKIGVQFKLLNIFGKHSVVCENLKLKPEVVNTSDMIIHVHQCKISHLQIAIDSSKQQLLSAKVNGVHLVLKFNKNLQTSSSTKTLQKPEIQQFKRVISSQETYDKIKFFQGSPFKQMIIEQVLRKTNLLIQNVDVCLLYSQTPIQKSIGLKVGELNICQRFIINRTKNGQNLKEEEIQCKLNNIGLYFGITENETMIKPSFHKQVIKPSQNSMKKRYFLEKNNLVVYFNEGNNTLSVISELLELNLSAFYIRQILTIINEVKPLMSKAPKIRPGQGKEIVSGKYKFSEGTAEWWKFLGMNLVQKIKQKQQYNIIQNRQYRLYLYCLLYCYTYGSQPIYLNYIESAQRYKKAKHVMNSHKFIIEKVYKIQHKVLDSLEQMELRGFVSFLSMKPKKKVQGNGFSEIKNSLWQQLSKLSTQKELNYNDVKKIKYEDIKKSKVLINFPNCLRFISQYDRQSKNVLSVFFRLRSFQINLVQTRQEIKMLKQVYQQNPQHFHIVKQLMMDNYYYEHLKSAPKDNVLTEYNFVEELQKKKHYRKEHNNENLQFSPILMLKAEHINMQIIENRFSFTIGRIKARQADHKQKILDIKTLSIVNSALEKYSERQGRIINVGNQLQFRLGSIFLNATVKTAERLLMLKTMLQEPQTQMSNESQSQNDSFINKFMNKKIVSDSIFNNLQKQSMNFLIQSIILVTPAFDKDKIFQINLNKLQCDYPASGTKTVSLEKVQLKRTTFQNLKNQSWKRLGQNQSVILQNDRSFTILISQTYQQKIDPKYFEFIKTYSSLARDSQAFEKRPPNMIEHDARSCFNLIIPFIFVQLACEDIYYLMIIKKFWLELMRNPYIFRPKLKTMEALEEANKPQSKPSTLQFIKEIQKNTKLLFETHITLNGFEFIFNGDSSMTQEDDYSGVNRICTVMIDSINFDSESRLKDDQTKIKIKNMYVRNMLGNDLFNVQSLEDVFKEYIEKKEPLIHRKNNQYIQNSYLIMYNHYTEDFQTEDKVPFLDIDITNSMNIQKLKGHNNISVEVKAFELFHEPKFFRTLVEIFTKLDLISGKHYEESRSKFFEKSFIKETNDLRDFQVQEKFLNQNKQILYSKDFSVINSMHINLKKVNIIVLLECEPVYCIALDSININHKTQSYITVYNITIKQAYIVDVSLINGPHSMIIESTTPIQINFTQYNCELLKERYKRSALMRIQIKAAVIHFLNKKIMEFVSFILQLKEDILGKPEKTTNKYNDKNDPQEDYPFCYEIILIDSKAILYRSSLSKQKMIANIGTISVTNFRTKSTEETIKKKTMTTFKNPRSQVTEFIPNRKNNQRLSHNEPSFQTIEDRANETHYEEMEQISDNHFKSFLDESIEDNEKNDIIYIDLFNLSIEGRHRKKEILVANNLHMSFRDIQLKVFIPQLDLTMDSDDFRLLIRLTEENLSQQDRYFRVNPVFNVEKIEKFITMFHVIIIKMECIKGDYGVYEGSDIETADKKKSKDEQDEEEIIEKRNILNLRDLRGKDVSFINGEKLDQIEIEKIYGEEENMNQFIEKYTRQKNDPVIQVKPQSISHSQQYFTKLSNIFDIFSKLGDQGDQASSDFDYKEQEILKHPNRGKMINLKDEQSSNCEKLMKWLRGMCDKCFWWTKNKKNEVDPYSVVKVILDKEVQRRRNMNPNMIQEHTIFCNGDYNLSHIFNDKQMIRLENKVSPQTFFPLYDPKYPNQIYFRMDMETTKQKKMYILAKELALTYEPNKGLLDLSLFFARPYGPYQDYDPPFIASNFNNFRPAQMYMELKDSRLQMKKDFIKIDSKNFEKIQSTEKITIFLDLIYNMETMGDMIKGPGKSIKQADIILQAFHAIYKEGSTDYIQLSNLIEMIYRNEANVSYKKKERTRFNEKIIIKPYFDKERSVNLFIPAFSIKSLMQIYQANINPLPAKTPNAYQSKQDLEQIKMNRMTSAEPKSGHYLQEKVPKTQQLASKIDEKKQRIKQKDVESSITSRKVYLESICINIESKLHTSFVKLHINNMMFTNVYSNMIKTQKSKMELNSELAVYYWNLHLLQFEPFMEPWNSKLIMKNIKRENTLSKKIKLESFNKALEVDNFKNQNNWLNLNLSSALFHTYKELQLKYYQGKDQQQEECFDTTFPELPNILKLDFKESQTAISKTYNKFSKKKNFPEAMKNFFGRRFIVEAEAIRKKGLDLREHYFHEHGTVYNLYHSYFDHQKRKKTICYRTPFRIMNCFSDKMIVRIKVKHASSTIEKPQFLQWRYNLSKGEYWALPSLIYRLDFLISFEHPNKHLDSALRLTTAAIESAQNMLPIQDGYSNLPQRESEDDNFISAQYLMQLHCQKSEFRKDKNSKILKKLFSQDAKKDRYLDSRDILIKTGKRIFALICTKSEYDNDKQKTKIQFYDTLVAIVTPIEIYNNCPIPLTVILNGKKEYKLPINKSTYINQDLNFKNIHQTVIEFREHILHREFTFLKKENENHTYFMQIDRMQSVNVRVIKETTSTFSIEIFADWIVENSTDEEFQLDYMTKLFPIDRQSTSSLAIENYQHGKKIEMALSIYSQDDSHHYPYDIVTNGTQATQIITLYKKFPDSEEKKKLLERKKNLKIKKRCCFKGYPFIDQTKQKKSDDIFKVYSFVLKIFQYEHCKLTKKMSLRYKTKMKNRTNKILMLYQYSSQFLIQKLYPDNEVCIWSYDFLPEHYIIEKRYLDEQTNNNFELDRQQEHRSAQRMNLSDPFKFDQSMGKLVTIKFKENPRASSNDGEFYKNFSYLKMEIQQHDHSSLYEFTEVSINSNDEFPIYIHNTTEQTLKIYENGESFLVKPKSKVPFSWSNLVHNTHEIDVEIGDVKKTYSFKQNQEFQPIVIKDETIAKPTLQQPKTNFHKEICRVKYGLIEGKFETIIDIKENCLIILPGLEGIEYKFDMKKAVKMTTSAQSIELNLGPKSEPLIIYPSNETYEIWLSYLNYTINQDVVTKVSFTIETYKNSRLFFFHNVQLGRQNDYLTSSQNYFVQNLFVSVINEKPQEVILVHLGDIRVTKEDRACRLGYDDYQIQKCDRKIEVKQVKINNQLENAVNPVILTQIKKSKTPFISVITKKRNLVKSKEDLQAFQFKDELITHFESFRFFLDEAEAMVEASLIPKLLNLKNQMDKVQTQYRIDKNQQEGMVADNSTSSNQGLLMGADDDDKTNKNHHHNNLQDKKEMQKMNQLPLTTAQQTSYQLYLSFLQIRPIKMTVSVSFDKLSKDQQQQRMNMQMLNMLPVGIQNAIITIDSYMFHHIYEDKDQVLKQIHEFYKSQLTKQVLINAGNLEFLVAIDLIKNLGIGVKNIFYDPIYQFASNKDIKNTTSTLLEGVFSLFLFIISFFVKMANLVFKIFAICTFDTDYKAKREIFRKQIFKSPLDGTVFGGKYFWRIIKSYKDDFIWFPKHYYEKYSVVGCLFGFILAILNIVPWMLKVFITFYDMFYVIGIGFLSWGHYEQNAMKNRSRPIRVFHKKKLVEYNLLEAKAYEIMRKHNINLTQKQSILYVRDVDNVEKTTSYLILSDYSLLYCDNRLSLFDEIILYKVLQFRIVYPQEKKGRRSVCLQISLKSPNIRKFLFLEFTKYTYSIKFKCYQELLQLLQKLEELKEKSQQLNKITQKYDYAIVDDKKAFNKEEIEKLRKKSQPLEYKEMNYLQPKSEQNDSQNAMLEEEALEKRKAKPIEVV